MFFGLAATIFLFKTADKVYKVTSLLQISSAGAGSQDAYDIVKRVAQQVLIT